MKLKLIATALVLAFSAQAQAAIDAGNSGNGELFISVWDSNGSYTRDLNVTIDAFHTALAAGGNIDMSWAADANFTSYLAGVVNVSALKWNVVATDVAGARRILNTFTTLPVAGGITNDNARTAATNVLTFATAVNAQLGAQDSVSVGTSSPAYAGIASYGEKVNNKLNFSNAGTFANDSAATGLGFMRLDALATGVLKSTYTAYTDNGNDVKVYISADNTLHIAAVPEPEGYAMFLAGLGVVGAIARRRMSAI